MARNSRIARCAVALLAALTAFAPRSFAEPRMVSEHAPAIEKLWPAAQARGISRLSFDRFAAEFVPDPEVMAMAASQPEHIKPMSAYLADLVTPERIAAGRALAERHAALLASIERTYGVSRYILLAIWGVESNYGSLTGSRSIVRSLATLAISDTRRGAFWTKELVDALRIIQDGQATPDTLVGSWAGASGHTQFIPSAYLAHAVDFDKDGRRDIWGNVADALASSASYLRSSGWAATAPWGFEVILPAGFDCAWSAPGRAQSLSQWLAAGVRIPASPGNLHLGLPLQLILPAGAEGPAFLVTRNYRAILRYNNSMAYALTVGHLADRLAGGQPLAASWPTDDRPLARAEREELQRLLAARGYDTGGVDGILGDQTRHAIRLTQRALNLAEDGHPSLAFLQQLRATVAP